MPRFPLPPIVESAEELLKMRRGERDERRRERLHLLWHLASGVATDRLNAAKQLGRNRETLSRWLEDYARGGLAALLRTPQRPGPPSRGGIGLPSEVQAAVRARLAEPRGERGYLTLWRWARVEHALTHSYSHFHRWVRGQLGATLKVARKSHGQKKDDQLQAFRDAGLRENLRAVQAAHPGQRVCLWTQDESRFGLHTVQRRRLTLPGVKPICPFEQTFESFWLCGAIQPNTGESFVLELPATDSDCLQPCLDQFALAHAQAPDEVQVLLMDNGGAHHAKALRWPERVVPVYLPAYCPELNPIERWWRELKDAVANQLFGTLDTLRSHLDKELASWNQGAERLCSLTSYPYLINALAMLD